MIQEEKQTTKPTFLFRSRFFNHLPRLLRMSWIPTFLARDYCICHPVLITRLVHHVKAGSMYLSTLLIRIWMYGPWVRVTRDVYHGFNKMNIPYYNDMLWRSAPLFTYPDHSMWFKMIQSSVVLATPLYAWTGSYLNTAAVVPRNDMPFSTAWRQLSYWQKETFWPKKVTGGTVLHNSAAKRTCHYI